VLPTVPHEVVLIWTPQNKGFSELQKFIVAINGYEAICLHVSQEEPSCLRYSSILSRRSCSAARTCTLQYGAVPNNQCRHDMGPPITGLFEVSNGASSKGPYVVLGSPNRKFDAHGKS
jgi:hypothetical protein